MWRGDHPSLNIVHFRYIIWGRWNKRWITPSTDIYSAWLVCVCARACMWSRVDYPVYFLPPKMHCAIYSAQLVCVCVCNIWIDVKRISFSSFFPLPFLITQGATGSLHGCRQRSSMQLTRIWSLINSTYLPFFDIARGQAQNPKHNDFISSRLPQSVFSRSSTRGSTLGLIV